MKLKELVSSLKISKELKKLGIKQENSFYYWVKKESSKIYQLFDRGTAGGISFFEEMCSAYTFAELLEVLPDKITAANKYTKSFGREMDYFLLITKTKKTKWFVLPDCYIGYRTLDLIFLCSKRADTIVDAAGKMIIYLIEEGIIKVNEENEKYSEKTLYRI